MTAAAGSGSRPRDGLSRRGAWLALLVALLTVLVAALSWWQTERAQAVLREQAVLRAEQRAVQLADAVNGQVEILLAAVDVALQQLRREWTGDAARFDALGRAIVATLPAGAVSHVSVAQGDGRIVYNSLGTQDIVNVADRDHFRVHRDGSDRLHVGKAVLSRLSGQWTFIVNRPLLRDGRFAGTMNVSVSSSYIARRLGAVALSVRDVVALVHDDGTFLARSRDAERSMGLRLPAERLPHLQQAMRLLGETPQTLEQVATAVGYQDAFSFSKVFKREVGQSPREFRRQDAATRQSPWRFVAEA